MKRSLSDMFLGALSFVYCFFLMYFPDFSKFIKIDGVVVCTVLTLVLFVFCLPGLKRKTTMMISLKNPLVVFVILNGLFAVYYAIRTLIAGTALSDWRSLRVIQNLFPVFQLFGSLLLFKVLEKRGLDNDKKIDFIFKVAIFQSLVAISALFIPFIKEICLDMFYKGDNNQNIYISRGRIFGFCNGNFTYDFQVATALIALTALNKAINCKKKKYYIISFLIIVASVLNGRTGTLIYVVGAIGLVFRLILAKGKVVQFALLVGATCVLLPGCIFVLSRIAPNSYSLFMHAIDDVELYRNGHKGGTETEQLIAGLRLPESGIDIIFGSGYRLYARGGAMYGNEQISDIGFVNDIFMAGIIFAILVYYPYITLAYKTIKNNKKWQGQFLIFVLFMIMANIKGELFRSQIIISVLLILLVFINKGRKNESISSSSYV